MQNVRRTLIISGYRELAFLLVGTALFGALNLHAQLPQPAQDVVNRNLPKPIPESPNVAALGKFGDYQVSHYSGLPDISIPIFEVKSGGLTVPVTLSYHASGVKPTDLASWVGMGWALSAGGQISRVINGKADENYYFNNALKTTLANCGGPGTGTFYYLRYAATGVTDTEQDVFSYSYPGGSGRFIIPYGESPYLFPFAPIDVKRFIDKYEIIDEKGVLYRFGKNTSGTIVTESSSTTSGGIPSPGGVTAWYLMEIIAPNTDDQITFSYQDVGTANTHDVAYTYGITDFCASANGAPCPNTIYSPQIADIYSWVQQKGNFDIFFKTGKIEFIMGGLRSDAPLLKTLDRVEIYNKVNGNYNIITIKIVNNAFDIEKPPTEFFKIDLYINGQRVKTLEEQESQFTFHERIDSLWLSAVVRSTLAENEPKTLLSKKVTGAQVGKRFCDIQIELDFSLADFYRIDFEPDTLTLKSRERIYWSKRDLTLYKRQ